MKRKHKRRGVSLGTVFMLAITLLVIAGTAWVLPKLSGETMVNIDAASMLQALSFSDGLPELSLSEIPISVSTSSPTAKSAPYEAVEATPVVSAAPQVTAEPTPTPFAGGTVTLTIGGSINMDEAIRQSGYYSEAKKYDFSDLFSLIDDEMSAADITLLSLENLVIPEKKVSSLIAPEAVMGMISDLGADVLALGFSNAFDQKLDGVTSTLNAAANADLKVVGMYESPEAAAGSITIVDNVKVGILHYTQSMSTSGAKAIKKADAAYSVPVADAETASTDIARLRAQGANIVLVSMNWDGSKSTPTKSQTTLAQQLADAGADVIVGTGTGIVQPVVWLDGSRSDGTTHKALCAYSLGSLISESRTNGGVASMLLQLQLTVDGAGNVTFDQTSYTPTYIWRYRQDSKYYYRVVASDQPSPDGMGDDQTEVKERAFENLKKYMGDESVLTLRSK